MDLYDDLEKFYERISSMKKCVETEEATKHSFVMPFLQILGYDVFDPNVIVPEFTADVGIKKGEKVDYAIMQDGKPIIIVEVKKHTESLDKYSSQLFRYFGVTETKFALLTNGIEYRFYSDMDKQNRLDEKPFLIVYLDDLNKRDVKALERFTKSELNIESILEMANKKRYIIEVKNAFEKEVKNPSDDFVRFFAAMTLPQGTRLTSSVIEEFRSYVKSAFGEIIGDLATKKINSIKAGLTAKIDNSYEETEENAQNEIETTEEELQGFFIVKSILSEVVSLDKIYARDTKSYFGILYEDNNRKWIARLKFNTSNKYLCIHEKDKEESKYQIEKLEDIYKYKAQLIATIQRLQNNAEASE